MVSDLAATFGTGLQLLGWLFVGFNLLVTAYGLVIGLRGLQAQPRLRRASTYRRFGVLIPAHNEALVLPLLLESLKKQRYSAEHLRIYVIADNCTDDTAGVARAAGATVLERFDALRRGKTWSLRWALAQLPLSELDAVVLFDADNLAHPDFLCRMNDHLETHPRADAVQGYLDVKNPDDSWVTRASALSYWMNNRFWNRARANWGLANTLGGTGLLIRSQTLRDLGWTVQSLTDDLEFSMQLILAGKSVHWNDAAITYDEKPVTFRTSFRQRQRWMQGHFWVLRHYGPRLLSRLFTSGRLLYWDAFLYLLNPLRVLMGLLLVAVQLISGRFLEAQGGGRVEYAQFAVSWAGALVLASALQVIVAPWARFGRVTLRYLPSLFTWALYGLSWLPIQTLGWLKSGDQGHWVKTEHTRGLRLSDLERSKLQ